MKASTNLSETATSFVPFCLIDSDHYVIPCWLWHLCLCSIITQTSSRHFPPDCTRYRKSLSNDITRSEARNTEKIHSQVAINISTASMGSMNLSETAESFAPLWTVLTGIEYLVDFGTCACIIIRIFCKHLYVPSVRSAGTGSMAEDDKHNPLKYEITRSLAVLKEAWRMM